MCDSHPKKQKWLSAESGCGCIYDDIQTVMSMPKCVAGLTGLGRPGAGNGQEKGEGCGGDPGDGGGLLDRRLRSQTGVQGTPGGFEWCGMGCGRVRLKGELSGQLNTTIACTAHLRLPMGRPAIHCRRARMRPSSFVDGLAKTSALAARISSLELQYCSQDVAAQEAPSMASWMFLKGSPTSGSS